jgi:hypothetical protein
VPNSHAIDHLVRLITIIKVVICMYDKHLNIAKGISRLNISIDF